jgi:hypothetical protein
MPEIKKILIPIILLFGMATFPVHCKAQIPDEIILSLNSGNAKTLSKYFNDNIELVVLDNDNVYSKAQAQQIVGNFFNRFAPVEDNAFRIIHDGGGEGAKYVIGNLKTKNVTFRVYFLLKKDKGTDYIHQLRIEKQ